MAGQEELLTTQQLQKLLQVDRTTIYRLARRGQIPALRIGGQWRFPRRAVEAWLQQQATVPTGEGVELAVSPTAGEVEPAPFPLECVQQIQDAFADLLGATLLVTDLGGRFLTEPSRPGGLWSWLLTFPHVRERIQARWRVLAGDPSLQPRFYPDDLGLLWARGLVRVGEGLRAMVLAGGLLPDVWPPTPEEVGRLAARLQVPESGLYERLHQAPRLDEAGRRRLLTFVQRIADILAHITAEQAALQARLRRIAQLATLEEE